MMFPLSGKHVWVAGRRGMVSSAIVRRLAREDREIDPRYFRPTEGDLVIGDASGAKENLGWAHEIRSQAVCAKMVAADLITVAQEQRRNVD